MTESANNLAAALARQDIQLPAEQVELLDRYRELLWDWNTKINLTRHTDLEKFVGRDVVDSLALERFLDPGEQVIDLGTGGGVPGVILKILRPDLELILTESVAKKAKAVGEIVKKLRLNLPVYHGRAEQLLEEGDYDTVVARAVAPLHKLITWFEPHWDSLGQLLVVKGRNWEQERGEARHRGLLKNVSVRRLYAYTTPGGEAESVVLRIQPRE